MDGSEEILGSTAARNLKAQGWAWLGNARRLALDFPAAERAFQEAEWSLPAIGRGQFVVAEVLYYKAALRRFQRLFDEATSLADEATRLFRTDGGATDIARALLLRADISLYSGRFEDSIPDLLEAQDLLKGQGETFLEMAAFHNLAFGYASSGDWQKAHRIRPTIQRLFAELPAGHDRLRCHIRWLDALIAFGEGDLRSAERLLVQVKDEMLQAEEIGHVAVASLELGLIFIAGGRYNSAARNIAESLPLLSAFDLRREEIAAIKMLRTSLERENVSRMVVEEALETLRQVGSLPSPRKT